MGNKALLILFGVTLAITSANSIENPIIIDDDTVVIGELSQGLEGRMEPDHTNSEKNSYAKINGHSVTISCTTARNSPGECKTFGECYPLFKLRENSEQKNEKTDSKEKENTPFDELQTLYKTISGPCSEDLLETISNAVGTPIAKQNYVCCPSSLNYTRVNRPARPPVPTPTPYQNQRCGKYVVKREVGNETSSNNDNDPGKPQSRIVNGREATRGEFPWAVALMMNNRQFCGGSLIDAQHVLTAAHCVYFMNRNDVNRLRVQIGDHNIFSTRDGPHENRGASNVYYHRTFSMRTLYHDVSVIRLSTPVRFTKYIQPICLSTNTMAFENQDATVAGWGQVSERGSQSSVLRTVNVRVWNHNSCSRKYTGKAPAGISKGMVCAGGSGYDSCKGDSGGPLSVNRGSVSQIGIVSWGIGCGTYPGVYTRVDAYLDWINKNRR